MGVAAGEGYVLSGTFSARDAGTYTAVATPDAEHCWEDGTTGPKDVKWSIARAKVAAPVASKDLTYNGRVQAGVAVGTGYTLSGTASATNAGTYAATATPDANHCWEDGSTGPIEVRWTIARAASSVSLADQAKTYTGKAIAYTGKVTRSGSAGAVTYQYFSDKACTKEVASADVKNAGTYFVQATLAEDANHNGATSAAAKLTVSKAKQPMAVKAVKRTAKATKLRKKAVTVAAPLKLTKKAQGKVTYAKVAMGSAKCLTVNKKDGKVTVKKGTKKGTYKVKVKVTAKGNANYKAGSKTVTCKVVVK